MMSEMVTRQGEEEDMVQTCLNCDLESCVEERITTQECSYRAKYYIKKPAGGRYYRVPASAIQHTAGIPEPTYGEWL